MKLKSKRGRGGSATYLKLSFQLHCGDALQVLCLRNARNNRHQQHWQKNNIHNSIFVRLHKISSLQIAQPAYLCFIRVPSLLIFFRFTLDERRPFFRTNCIVTTSPSDECALAHTTLSIVYSREVA